MDGLVNSVLSLSFVEHTILHNLSLPLLRSKCAKKDRAEPLPTPSPPPGFPRFVCMCGCGPQRKYVRWTRPAVKGWPGPTGPMTSNRAVLGNMPGTGRWRGVFGLTVLFLQKNEKKDSTMDHICVLLRSGHKYCS
jgi:hypothetical protein